MTCAEHIRQSGPMWPRVDGVAATLSREDAIDATAVSPTRRDGPDNSPEIEKETTHVIVR